MSRAAEPGSRVLFRVDAGPGIGLGHVKRSMTLAGAFANEGHAPLLLTTTPEHVTPHAGGFEVSTLALPRGSAANRDHTSRVATESRARLVILDGYAFDDTYAEGLRTDNPVWIVDAGFEGLRPGFVLNPNLHAKREDYPGMEKRRVLAGPAFALLRDEFFEPRDRSEAHAGPPRVLLTMGGADPVDMTSRLLEVLEPRAEKGDLVLRVLVGAGHPRRTALAARGPHVECDPQSMSEPMRWCDVALTAAGGTCLELAALGVPALAVAIADNQRPVLEELGRRGIMASLGWHADVTPQRVERELSALLGDTDRQGRMRAAAQDVVDGRGKHRAAAHLLREAAP